MPDTGLHDMTEAHRAFVAACLDAFMARGPHHALASDMFIDDGVPVDMMLGEPDDDGYVAWKILPSTVSMEELQAIEARMPGPFPPVFRAYCTTRHVLGLTFDRVVLPHLPPEDTLASVRNTVQRWHLLQESGYCAFSESDAGPICFDLHRRHLETGDCPVLFFDREELDAIGADQWDQRSILEPSATLLFPGFHGLLERVFSP